MRPDETKEMMELGVPPEKILKVAERKHHERFGSEWWVLTLEILMRIG